MARIHVLTPETATEAQKEIFDATRAKFGKHPLLMSAMTNSTAMMSSYLTLFQNLTEGRFSKQLARKIGLAIGEENGCEYCISLLAAVAKQQKLTDEDIELARHGKSSDAKEQALLDFVLLVVRYKGDLTDAEVDAVKAAGWSDEDIAEVFGHLILNFLTNYFWKVARTDIDFPVLRLFDQSKIARGSNGEPAPTV
ncbi:carboxymuconolactone decarboxylase family protein [Terriglobus sp. TAA 43]|uniref:carboxymuconolactone decarboxylase family protein n=1 Tax=Terriglobus sp. TAA 43 TaxID=278961 RepID=UPI0006483B03|nr:carboxymuconolactone decarboxylase family protein [Terriglobus sp. TAA 43]